MAGPIFWIGFLDGKKPAREEFFACTIPWQGVVARAARGEVVDEAEIPAQARRLADGPANERKAGAALPGARLDRTRSLSRAMVPGAAALAA